MINRTINKDSILHHVSVNIVTNQTNHLLHYFKMHGRFLDNVKKAILSPEFREFLFDRYSQEELATIAGFLKCLEKSSKTGKYPSDDSFSLSEENISEEDQDEEY